MTPDNQIEHKIALHNKIVAISIEIPKLVKNATNTFHHYDYLAAELVFEKVGEKVTEKNMTIIRSALPDGLNITNNKDQVHIHQPYAFVITDADTGYSEQYVGIGSGADKGDKGAYKAATGAKKQFLMDLFSIPAVDNADDPDQASDVIGSGKKQNGPARGGKFNPDEPFGKNGIPFGQAKGKTIQEASTDDLCWILPKLADDSPTWAARNRAQRMVIYGELVKRWNDGLSDDDQAKVKEAKKEYKRLFPDG
jgi:hypothetical protein